MGKSLGTTALTYLWEKINELFSTGTAGKAQSIPFGKVDSTSTATAFTATVEGITELKNGTCVYLMNGKVTSAAATTSPKCFTLNINGLGAKPVYYTTAAASYATTQFNVNSTMLFVYNTTRVSSGCWDLFYGFDSNTNTLGYQLRTNSSTLPAKFKTYRYRLLFTSADHAHFVAANASTSTDANAAKTVTTEKIDPFGPIVYYGYTTAINANANFGATYLWTQYTLNIGYSFNRTGAAASLTFPALVYVKAAPQADGSAIIDATTPYVQALPSTEDGKIYIFLGLAYSATEIELRTEHPVYYYKDGCIRRWTNAAETDISGKANTSDLANVAFSGSYNDLDDTPTIPSAVTESTVSGWGFTKNTGTYSKPSGGIPKSDLTDAVQTSLGKADTALQSFTESDPTVPSHVKGITTTDISNWNGKQAAIADLSDIRSGAALGATALQSYTETDPTVPAWAKAANKPSYTAAEVGALPDSTTIPTKVSDLTNDSGFTSNTGTITGIIMNGASKGTSGVVNLGTVLTEHQDISGKQDAITAVNLSVDANTGTPSGSASFNGGTLNLSFSNLKGVKGDTGETGATGPQGQTGPQGPKGDTGVSGDASTLAIIHSVDQDTMYNDTDVAGADAVQTTDKNLIDDEYALFGILENLHKTKAGKDEIPDTEEMELITATALTDIKERIIRKVSCHQITISSRPTNPTVGEHYYDITIHKPIWWSGTNWTDALGNNV